VGIIFFYNKLGGKFINDRELKGFANIYIT
jgi:hypothetical protein